MNTTKILFSLLLVFFTIETFGQCGCKLLTQNDGSIVIQCDPLPVASDSNTQLGLSFTATETYALIGVTVRFSSSSLKIAGDLDIRMANNQMLKLKMLNSQIVRVSDSELAQAIFIINDSHIDKLLKSNLSIITLKFSDGKLRTYKISQNSSVIKNQITCVNDMIHN